MGVGPVFLARGYRLLTGQGSQSCLDVEWHWADEFTCDMMTVTALNQYQALSKVPIQCSHRAYAPCQSRWALSSDDFLQSVGNNTGINYARDFEEYLEILVRGLQKKKKSILNVFREWDRVVFPNSDLSLVDRDQETSSGLKMAMEMLEADETEDLEMNH